MKTTKRFLSILLAALMVVGTFAATPLTASAYESGSCGDTARYVIFNNGFLRITGTGAIRENYFKGRRDIEKVFIYDGIESIGVRAFQSCSKLNAVMMADSVTSIGNYAFESCSKLDNVDLGGVTTIGKGAFKDCTALRSITIPDSVTTIEGGGFASCSNLTKVEIGSGVTQIDDYAFDDCESLDNDGVIFVRPNASQTLKVCRNAFSTSKMSYSGDSGYMLYDGENPIDENTDLKTLNGKTLTWKPSAPGTPPSVGVDPTEQPSGKLCKWDNTYHGDSFCGKIVYYFHTVLYFFFNLFGAC